MRNATSEPQIRRDNRRVAGPVLKVIGWAVAMSLALFFTNIIVVIITVLAAASLLAASFSEDVTTKYWVLLVWTVTALLLAVLAKFIVLRKTRNQHNLRWDEYIHHTIMTGVLSGGLAFGAVGVMIAAFGSIGNDIEAFSETENEARTKLLLLALLPLFIAAGAVWLTIHRYIVDIPKPKPRDK